MERLERIGIGTITITYVVDRPSAQFERLPGDFVMLGGERSERYRAGRMKRLGGKKQHGKRR